MRKIDFKKICVAVKSKGSDVLKKIKPYAPQIKIAAGVTCLLGAVGYSSVAGRKANQLLVEKKKETMSEELTPIEVVKTAGKVYIPVICMSLAGAGLVYSGTNDILKRNAALVGRYNLAVENAKAYREAITREIGTDKLKEITEKITSREPENTGSEKKESGSTAGKELFRDEMSGLFFWDTMAHVRQVCSDLNRDMLKDSHGVILLSDMLHYFRLPSSTITDLFFWEQSYGDIVFSYDGDNRTTVDDCVLYGVPEDVAYTMVKQINMPIMDPSYNYHHM